MADHPTLALARFASTLTLDAIPEATREYCKDLLLDTLACAVAGHKGEETKQVAAFAGALGQSSESSIIGGNRSTLAGATLHFDVELWAARPATPEELHAAAPQDAEQN